MNVPAGCVCGFLGPNGAGKTTTLRILMGLLPPDSGSVSVLGVNPARQGLEVRRRVGFVPDVSHLYQWMSVDEVFRFTSRVYLNWDQSYCREITGLLGLPTARTVKQLSRGELAKLNLIIAMSHRPRLLIMDEPTTGLDPLIRGEFLDVAGRLASREGSTVLFSTHILGDVDRIADRIVVVRDGRALADDWLNSLRLKYTKASFVFSQIPADNLNVPGAMRVHKGIREWVAVFDARDAGRLQAVARQIGAQDVLTQPMTVEDIFLELFNGSGSETAGQK